MKQINDNQYESMNNYNPISVKIDKTNLPKLGYLVCKTCKKVDTIDHFFSKNIFTNICNICLDRDKFKIILKDRTNRVFILFDQIDKRRDLNNKLDHKKIMKLDIYHDKFITELSLARLK